MKRIGILLAGALACLLVTPALLGTHGCTEVGRAYRVAEDPVELAYVLTEHYAALVKIAADLAQKPTTPPEAIRAMQKADAIARPLIQQLRPVRNAYLQIQSAETEGALQLAIDKAVLAIADLVRAVNMARGAK